MVSFNQQFDPDEFAGDGRRFELDGVESLMQQLWRHLVDQGEGGFLRQPSTVIS